jgi:DNA-binding beta-propeller fold protein YncE
VSLAIPVGTQPVGIAITPDGHTAYVANNNDNTVTLRVFSGETLAWKHGATTRQLVNCLDMRNTATWITRGA